MGLKSARKAVLLTPNGISGPKVGENALNIRTLYKISEQALNKLTADNFIIEPLTMGTNRPMVQGISVSGSGYAFNVSACIRGPKKTYSNGYLTIEGMQNGGGYATHTLASSTKFVDITYNVWLLMK